MNSSLKEQQIGKARKIVGFAFLVCFSIFVFTPSVHSFAVDSVLGTEVAGDFVVSPAKIETVVAPGETKIIEVRVLNRTGSEKTFKIGVEDFIASSEEDEVIELLAEETSTRTLKNFISINEQEFTLSHGEVATVPIAIAVPESMEAGGRFASVLFSTRDMESTGGKSQAISVPRAGVLIFAEVSGDVTRLGELKRFEVSQMPQSDELIFRLVYENRGNVHLNPYGIIEVKNIFGSTVETIVLDPWFTLPQSLRNRDVHLKKEGLFGVYSAKASINRGYENIVDEKTVRFSVWPMWTTGLGLLAVLSFLGLLRFLFYKQTLVK